MPNSSAKIKRLAIIHGPNLNLLGSREPEIYVKASLNDIDARLVALAKQHGASLETVQSNHEGDLVDFIQGLQGRCEGIIINAAAYTHTSVAIRDALLTVGIPYIEVHLSNTATREPFRHRSLLADKARGVISGLGAESYAAALRFFIDPVFD